MELSDKKIWLYGLFVACPEGTPSPDCPFEKYRNLSYNKRLSVLENFTEEETEEFIKHHHRCIRLKVDSILQQSKYLQFI